jgi:hypothetical protein
MGVAEGRADRTLVPTTFGNAVLSEEGFDPFLEDERTLWLLHWNVSSRHHDPLFAWDLLLNKWPYPELTASDALAAFLRESERLNLSHSRVTLAQHLDIFLHTYRPVRSGRATFEDSLDCPLAEIELLQVIGERTTDGRREPVYAFRREPKPEISQALFEHCIDDHWRRLHPGEKTLSYGDMATAPYSVGQLLKLPEDDIRARLDVYANSESTHVFRYQSSAIQGLLSRRSEDQHDFLSAVYSQEISDG